MSLIQNERTKLLANALDRASTACLAVGVFGPAAAALYSFGAASQVHGILLIVGTVIWLLLAVLLHFLARRVLGGLE